MRIDVVTIFPEYLAAARPVPDRQGPHGRPDRPRGPRPARLHARPAPDRRRHPGRRRRRHGHAARAVGRGARPRARRRPDRLGDPAAVPALVVPSPSGDPFTQALAHELAGRPWLAFACGRYEGIDERVLEDAAARLEVYPVSLGDYVLNGGEVAVLAIVEAVGRLLPGVVGNADSLVEESHEDGLLEYPVYTKPASWRGREVPPSCCRATTPRSTAGGANSAFGARRAGARTCWSGSTPPGHLRRPGRSRRGRVAGQVRPISVRPGRCGRLTPRAAGRPGSAAGESRARTGP